MALSVKKFVKDLREVHELPVNKKLQKLVLPDYPFDHQLLSGSSLYVRSRKLYNSLGGRFQGKLISTMRSLSAQDLFQDSIEYSPSADELVWFLNHHGQLVDPEKQMEAMSRFNEVSLYHEQNHRIVWRMLPPAPLEKSEVCRYLNFAESLVVTLDLALGDQLGKKVSNTLERLRLIYRPGGEHKWMVESSEVYRAYLLSLLASTYMLLERVDTRDILKALDYLFPDQKKLNKEAYQRSLELSELFTQNTNPQWQSRFWQAARDRLQEMHYGSKYQPLCLPEDPLDLDAEFDLAQKLFDLFEI